MKKQFLFIICVVFCFYSNAQNFQACITTSLNFNRIYGDGMQKTMQPGYSAGVYTTFKISDRFYLQPELLFSQNNINTSTDFNTVFPENASANFHTGVLLNYVGVPLLAGYQLNEHWAVNLGPEYQYLVGSDEKLLNDNKQAFKKDNISMNAGIEWRMSALKLYGRYNYGVANINAVNNVRRWNSGAVQLGIGWRLL